MEGGREGGSRQVDEWEDIPVERQSITVKMGSLDG